MLQDETLLNRVREIIAATHDNVEEKKHLVAFVLW
jgi:hypothetical protein